MPDAVLTAAALLAVLGAGTVGGVFFAFSAFVMAALARLAPAAGIAAMQAINVTVLGPAFLGVFFGTAALALVLAAAALLAWPAPGAGWRLAGALLYLAGGVGVTVAGNVPRNRGLARLDPADGTAAPAWRGYVAGWTRWNHVRTAACIAAAAAFALSLR